MEINITAAKFQDLPEILQLQKECYHTEAELHDDFNIPPLLQDLTSLEKDHGQMTILKGKIAGKIVASVRGFSKNGTCYIGRLIVDQAYQNQGIGKKMMQAIEMEFYDCLRFELFTGFKSEKNLYLYQKIGYQEFKREKINDKLTLVFLEKRILQV